MFVFCAIGMMLFQSCIVDEVKKPAKATLAATIVIEILGNVNSAVGLYGNSLYLKEWLEAETDEERYKIEDDYFSNLKVRKEGNIVNVLGYFEVNTFGNLLEDKYDSWLVKETRGTPTFDSLRITKLEDNEFRVVTYNNIESEYSTFTYGDTLNISNDNIYLTVSGKGNWYEIINGWVPDYTARQLRYVLPVNSENGQRIVDGGFYVHLVRQGYETETISAVFSLSSFKVNGFGDDVEYNTYYTEVYALDQCYVY